MPKGIPKNGINNGWFKKEHKLSNTHSFTGTRFYRIFGAIKRRCNNKKYWSYKHYGERGIKCGWIKFEEFKKDMYKSYLKHIEKFGETNTTIDRINNDDNYNKKNCKWSTQKEQCNNTRRSKLITYKGKTMSASDWCNKLKLNYSTFQTRTGRDKWSFEEALNNKKYDKQK